MVPDLEDICLEIRSTIGNSGFGIGIGITHEKEGKASVGHLQDDGVLVDVVGEDGGYQDGYILTGPSQYESSQVLNNSYIVHFDTVSQVQTSGPGIYEESMMLHSAGAAASGVTCGVDSLDAEGANFTATPYCETVVLHSLFMADDLVYRSVGSIDQADLEMPDSFSFTAIGTGSGTGSFSFGARSLAGIGTTTELGYVNSIGKDLMANGRFNIGEDVRWTSFAKTFDVVG